jgi:hypothetical protein
LSAALRPVHPPSWWSQAWHPRPIPAALSDGRSHLDRSCIMSDIPKAEIRALRMSAPARDNPVYRGHALPALRAIKRAVGTALYGNEEYLYPPAHEPLGVSLSKRKHGHVAAVIHTRCAGRTNG